MRNKGYKEEHHDKNGLVENDQQQSPVHLWYQNISGDISDEVPQNLWREYTHDACT